MGVETGSRDRNGYFTIIGTAYGTDVGYRRGGGDLSRYNQKEQEDQTDKKD
jgi:hypothetical protein